MSAAGGAITGGLAATGANFIVQAAVSGLVSAGTDLINQSLDVGIENVDWIQVGVAGAAGIASGLIGGNGIQHKKGSFFHAKKYIIIQLKV